MNDLLFVNEGTYIIGSNGVECELSFPFIGEASYLHRVPSSFTAVAG